MALFTTYQTELTTPSYDTSPLMLQWLLKLMVCLHYVIGCNNLLLNVIGCPFHGCSKCWSPDTISPITKLSNGEMVARTRERAYTVSQRMGCMVVNISSCFIEVELKANEELKEFFKTRDFASTMLGREGLFGGCFLFQIVLI